MSNIYKEKAFIAIISIATVIFTWFFTLSLRNATLSELVDTSYILKALLFVPPLIIYFFLKNSFGVGNANYFIAGILILHLLTFVFLTWIQGCTRCGSIDGKIISDMKQHQTALDMYQAKYGQFPKSLNDEKMKEFLPEAIYQPKPLRSKGRFDCPRIDEFTSYTYEPIMGSEGSVVDYKLNGCIEEDTASLKAGFIVADHSGLSNLKTK